VDCIVLDGKMTALGAVNCGQDGWTMVVQLIFNKEFAMLNYVGQSGVNLTDYINGSVVITSYNKPSYEKFGKRIGKLVDVGQDSILVEYKESDHYDNGEYRRYFKKDLQGIFYK
jgi:hypothetical protein